MTTRGQLQLSEGHLGTPQRAFVRLPGLQSGTFYSLSLECVSHVCSPSRSVSHSNPFERPVLCESELKTAVGG